MDRDVNKERDGSHQFVNCDHELWLLARLDRQRKAGDLHDLVIQVKDKKFPCHRAVLASTWYFKTMLSSSFSEGNSKVVQLHGIDSNSFSKILDFLYTGVIRIGNDDVQDILQAAHMLLFDKIVQYCRQVVQDNLCPSNCLSVMRLADMYGLTTLKQSAKKEAVSHFSEVGQNDEFQSLSLEELLDLLTDKDLKVTDEDDVVHSAIRWLDHDPESLKTAVSAILEEIRLSCVRVSALRKLEVHPVIREYPKCLAKITAAIAKHLAGTWQLNTIGQGAEAKGGPRRGMSDDLTIIVGGLKATEPTTHSTSPLQSVICADPDSRQHYHVTNLPSPDLGYLSVTCAKRRLYVTGGRVRRSVFRFRGRASRRSKILYHSTPSRQAFCYDFSSDTWIELSNMPRGRAGHQSVIVNGKLFLVGGDVEAHSLLNMDYVLSVDCYNLEAGAWTDPPTLTVDSPWDVAATSLPFSLFGHSLLRTQKSNVGWYCRDLEKLERAVGQDERKLHSVDKMACKERTTTMLSFRAFYRSYRHFTNCEHECELATKRKTGEFLDLLVKADGREFPCHRAVLASTPYFKTMLSSSFAEGNSKVVQLHGIDSSSFSKVLDFLYTGEICIGHDDVQDILQAAHMLQFDKIVGYCQEFIQDNVCPSNCLGVLRLADMYGFSVLEQRAKKEVVCHFSEICQTKEFLSLSLEELLDILRDNDLKITNEDDVVHSVIRWLDHAPESRKTTVLSLLEEIRLSYVRVSALRKLESHSVIREFPECLAKITAAKDAHLTGKRHRNTSAEGAENKRGARRGMSDDLTIIVGGWMGKEHHDDNDDDDGNLTQPTPLQNIICLDPDSQKYYHVTDLPTPVSGYLGVTCAQRRLYVTGGCAHPLVGHGPHNAPSRQAFCYDFPSDTWTPLPDMPRGRAGHLSVVWEGQLFLVGGDVEATSTSTIDCYDLEAGAWMKTPTPPTVDIPSNFAASLPPFETKKSSVGWYCRDIEKLETAVGQDGRKLYNADKISCKERRTVCSSVFK